MLQKKNDSSTGEWSLKPGYIELSLSDKYVCLQQENQKLRRQIRKIGEAFHDWRELALEYQAERDCLKEQIQEKAQEGSDRE